MSVEQAMIVRSQPQAIARRINSAIAQEVTKGCTGDISPVPVRLEPAFSPLFAAPPSSGTTADSPYLPASTDELTEPFRLRLWISPKQKFDWNRSELWLKQLAIASGRVVFQIVGNVDAIEVSVLCAPRDSLLIKAAFEAQFNMCEITSVDTTRLEGVHPDAWAQAQFLDFYPPPPYSHMLTCFNELHTTPFEALLTTMRLLPTTATAFYQCMFQPVHPSHDWHQNVYLLLDLEFTAKLHNSPASSFRAMQQTPSGDLRQMAKEVEVKAHNDKPFFSAAVRMGVVGNPVSDDRIVMALASSLRVFQHGGRPLECLCQSDYQRCLEVTDVRRMLAHGFTHRAGFLVNSQELTGLVHVFPTSILDPRKISLETLPSLPLRTDNQAEGTFIGTCRYAGVDHRVYIPLEVRERSVHVISTPGMGKTTIQMNMLLEDIPTMGAVYFDPHGDAIKDLLKFIPPSYRHRCIYFNPGDPDWIPLWNPLRLSPGGNVYRISDDLISIFKRVFKNWGDRLEHVIRNGLIGLGQLQNMCLADLYTLTRQKAEESDDIRRQIVNTTVDEPVRKFWEKDFLRDYSKSDLQAPKHKLSKLVSAGPVSLMLSQPESLINLRNIMDNKGILLVDLSELGADVRDILGSFMLMLFLTAAVSRSDTDISLRHPFSMYVDEAHLFVSGDAIEEIITQARKFHVNICLAHQYLKQFNIPQIDAITSVGSTLMGKLDEHDSQFFVKHLQGKVEAEEIMALERGEVIARVGTDIMRIKTPGRPKEEYPEGPRQIIEESRRRYCRPAAEVRRLIRNGLVSRQEPFASPDSHLAEQGFSQEDLRYEEF